MISAEPISPMRTIEALHVMKEGHDGSGVGLYLNGLTGPFEDLKDCPILSGIFTEAGMRRLDHHMAHLGFHSRHSAVLTPKSKPPLGTPQRGAYLARAYETPTEWKDLPEAERELKLVKIRLDLRQMGQAKGDMMVFSFWPDTIMLKEVGDPMTIADYLKLDRKELFAKRILAQGRQNTNYAINLYACHPFFLQGVSTMTNGENTAFVPIREYLLSRGVLGYEGYNSDSEVFTHIMHFTLKRLGLGVEYYKHVITPLSNEELQAHPNSAYLARLKQVCRKMIIDGPNCVIGCLPDNSMFMVQDRKKLRPGVVGGRPGLYAFSSEICGLNAAIPDRDKTNDFQPMYLDTCVVGPECKEVRICKQNEPLPRQH